MIPETAITHWRRIVPWSQDSQVEQDLILSRALVELYREQFVADGLRLRGGTALHKLFFDAPRRYSEDIDLVQVTPGPAGPLIDAIRTRLDPILGAPRRETSPDNITLKYRVQSEIPPIVPLRLKLEINTREHVCLLGAARRDFGVRSPWYAGSAVIETFRLEELLATKLRALYQRRKGRDLYDLFVGLQVPGINAALVMEAFLQYMRLGGSPVSRRVFEDNLADKANHRGFHGDLAPLLAAGEVYSPENARELVVGLLISKL
jgi:predicted nucleotidyltransferase component of viral defense system